MTFETITLSNEGAVARIALNRPDKLNAINKTMLNELNQALDQVEQDENIYALVLSGNGRAFCVGFDLQSGIEANHQGVKDWRVTKQAIRSYELMGRNQALDMGWIPLFKSNPSRRICATNSTVYSKSRD